MCLFFLKTSSSFKNKAEKEGGLTYNSAVLEDLLAKDADGDGLMDWEEGLYGTDPKNKDTDGDGTPDNKEEIEIDSTFAADIGITDNGEAEGLTQTDQFSRELVATMAALSQTGDMDAATAEQLATTLTEKIVGLPQQKVYTLEDLKITKDESAQSFHAYNNSLGSIAPSNSTGYTVLDVLEKFVTYEEGAEPDSSVLEKLDPLIEETREVILKLTDVTVPASVAPLHLTLVNDTERLLENLTNIQLYEVDAIVALSAISQYENNVAMLNENVTRLTEEIARKLGS